MIGFFGGILYALCVTASCFGVTNAVTFTTGRLIHAAAREHHLPLIFGTVHPKSLTPVAALFLHGTLTSMFLALGSFGSLVVLNEMVECYWYFVSPFQSLAYLGHRRRGSGAEV